MKRNEKRASAARSTDGRAGRRSAAARRRSTTRTCKATGRPKARRHGSLTGRMGGLQDGIRRRATLSQRSRCQPHRRNACTGKDRGGAWHLQCERRRRANRVKGGKECRVMRWRRKNGGVMTWKSRNMTEAQKHVQRHRNMRQKANMTDRTETCERMRFDCSFRA